MNTFVANLEHNLEPAGYEAEEVNVGATVVSPERRCESIYAFVSVKTNSVKVTFDGTDPATDGAGAIYEKGNYVWSGSCARKARFVEATGGQAAVVRIERMC